MYYITVPAAHKVHGIHFSLLVEFNRNASPILRVDMKKNLYLDNSNIQSLLDLGYKK